MTRGSHQSNLSFLSAFGSPIVLRVTLEMIQTLEVRGDERVGPLSAVVIDDIGELEARSRMRG